MSYKPQPKKSYTQLNQEFADKLKISFEGALDVTYLRTRQRWTKPLEAELIRLHQAGTPPDMNTFGCPEGITNKVFIDRVYGTQNRAIAQRRMGY